MEKQVESPCVSICQLDDNDKFCIGCYRTPDEIEQWSSLSSSEKLIILSAIEARKLELNNTEPQI